MKNENREYVRDNNWTKGQKRAKGYQWFFNTATKILLPRLASAVCYHIPNFIRSKLFDNYHPNVTSAEYLVISFDAEKTADIT